MNNFSNGKKVTHSPPGGSPALDVEYDSIKELNKKREKALKEVQSRNRRVTKKLIEEKDPVACALPLERQRSKVRCGKCPGCSAMALQKGCHKCNGCKNSKGCVDKSRACCQWPLMPTYRAYATSSIGSHDLLDLRDEISLLRGAVGKASDLADILVEKVNIMPLSHPVHATLLCKRSVQAETEADLEAGSEVIDMAERWILEKERLLEVDDTEDITRFDPGFGGEILQGDPIWVTSEQYLARQQAERRESIAPQEGNLEITEPVDSRGSVIGQLRGHQDGDSRSVEESPGQTLIHRARVNQPQGRGAGEGLRARASSLDAISAVRRMPRRPEGSKSHSLNSGRDQGAVLWGMAQGLGDRKTDYEEELTRWEKFIST